MFGLKISFYIFVRFLVIIILNIIILGSFGIYGYFRQLYNLLFFFYGSL